MWKKILNKFLLFSLVILIFGSASFVCSELWQGLNAAGSKGKSQPLAIAGGEQFRVDQAPVFSIPVPAALAAMHNKPGLLGLLGVQMTQAEELASFGVKGLAVNTFDGTIAITPQTEVAGDQIKVTVPKPTGQFRPGKYTLTMQMAAGDQAYLGERDFYWGVLAINTDKAEYAPGDTAYLQLAALMDDGDTICHGNLNLAITEPDGTVKNFSTKDETIAFGGKCQGDNVTDKPDYFLHYRVGGAGTYSLKLTNLDNGYTITDSFAVRAAAPFVVERTGATRINPMLASYTMKIVVKANENFKGDIREPVPQSFVIENEPRFTVEQTGDGRQNIVWRKIYLKKGQEIGLEYTYDAPKISPRFYELGPLQIGDYVASRAWQIAADATVTSIATGNWTATTTWSGGAEPPAGSDVVVSGGFTVTMNVSAPPSPLSVTVGGGTAGTLTIALANTSLTFTVTGNVTVNANGNFTVTNVSAANAHTVNIGGNLVENGVFNMTTGTDDYATVVFNGTAQQTISGTGATCTFFSITDSNTNAAGLTLARNVTVSPTTVLTTTITVTAGDVLDLAGFTMNRSTTGAGSFIVNAGSTLKIGGTNSFPTNYTTNTLNATSTVNYYGTNQTVTALTYGHLTLSTSGTKTMTSVTTIAGNFTMSGSAATSGMVVTTIGGNVDMSGTAQATTGANLAITGTMAIHTGATFTVGAFTLGVTSTTTVDSGGTLAFTGTAATTFTGDVTVNGVWNEQAAVTPSFAGNLTNNATTWTASSGVHTFTGTTKTISGTTATVIPSVSVSGTYSNTNTLTVATALAGAGGLTNSATGVLNIGGTSAITTLTATASGNTVNYNGAGQTLHNNAYWHLTLSGSGTKTMTSITTVSGNFTMSGSATTSGNVLTTIGGNVDMSGTATTTTGANLAITGMLNIHTGTTFTVGAFTLGVTSTTTVDSGGSLVFSSATNPGKTFTGDVTVNGVWNEQAAVTPSFGGNFTNNATTWTASSGVHTFSGTTKTISGTTASVIPSVSISGTIANSNTLTVATLLTIGGTLTNNGTTTATTALSGAGGLTNGATGTLYITGTSGITTITATASGNTINYNGAGQTLHSNAYYNLTLSGSGTKTMTGITTVSGNFTMSGSATTATNVLTTIGGNVDMSGTATTTTGANLAITGMLNIHTGTTFTVGAFTMSVGGTTTVDSGGSLVFSSATNPGKTFTGDVTVNGVWNEQAAITPSFGGSLADNATSWTASSGAHTFTGTTKTISGSITVVIPSVSVSGTYSNTNTLTVATLLTVGGTLTNNGTITATTALSGAGGLVNAAGAQLTITGSAGITTLTATASNNTVTYNGAGQTLHNNAYYNLTLSGSGTDTMTGIATVSGNFTMSGSAVTSGMQLATVGGNVDMSGTSQATTGGNLAITGTLSIHTGTTFTDGGYTLGVGGATTVDAGGTLAFSGGATPTVTLTGDVTVNGVWNEINPITANFAGSLLNQSTSWTASTGVHTFSGTGKSIDGTSSTVIPSVSVSGTYTNGKILLVQTLLTVSGTFTSNGNVSAITALSGVGSFVNNATLNIGGTSGITTLTATAANNIVNYSGAGQTLHNNAYYNLTLSGSGTKTMTGITTVSNNFTMSGSATTSGNVLTTIGGNVDMSGTSSTTTGANLTISGNLSIHTGTTFTVGAFTLGVTGTTTVDSGGSLVFFSAANPAMTFTGDVTVNGVWNEQGAVTPSFAGSLTNNATTWTASSGSHTFTGTTKTLGGSTATVIQNVSVSGTYSLGGTLNATNLTISSGTLNTSSNSLAVTGTTSITGTLGITGISGTMSFGTITVNSGGTFNNAANLAFSVSGDITNNQTFTAGSGTVTLNGGGGTTQTITGGLTFANLTANAAAARTIKFAAGSTTTVTGLLTFSGSSGQLLTLTTTSSPTQWVFHKTSLSIPVLQYLDVNYSNNTGSPLCAIYSQSTSHNNTGWSIGSGLTCNTAPTITRATNDTPDPVIATSNALFTATATDAEGDAYWLIVCKTNVVSAGSPPSCASSQLLCVSSTGVASGTANTCTWTASGSGTVNWYAFACDNNASSMCSTVDTANSPITVTPLVISLSVNPTSTAYGTMPANSVKKATTGNANNEFVVFNEGNVTEDFDVVGADASGGTPWTLSTTAVGVATYMHAYSSLKTLTAGTITGNVGDQASKWVALDKGTNYRPLATAVGVLTSVDLVLELLSPTSGDSTQKSTTVTVRATQH